MGRRSELDIVYSILNQIAQKPLKLTKILRKCNTCLSQFKKYEELLTINNLMKKENALYIITTKGRQHITKIKDVMKDYE